MLNIIYGRSGSGKSYRTAEMIRESFDSGKLSLLIVPEQHTVAAERMMAEYLPEQAQLCFEALNFTRLADRVFRRHGGLTYNYIGAGARELLMWRVLRELSPHLCLYGSSPGDVRLAPMMCSAVTELKINSVTPAALEDAAQNFPGDSALGRKLSDIAAVYGLYDSLVSEIYGTGSDSADLLSRLADTLWEHDYFRGYDVFIDEFTSFTRQEYSVLTRIIGQADSVTVTLGCDSPRDGRLDGDESPSDSQNQKSGRFIHFETLYDTSRRLRKIAAECNCEINEIILGENRRAVSVRLAELERRLWDLDGLGDCAAAEKSTDDSAGNDSSADKYAASTIAINECADPYDEAETAARAVLARVHTGARFSDMAVIVRDTSRWNGIIDGVFEKYGIPVYVSRRTAVTSKPLVGLITSALAIYTRNWRLRDLITYIRTGLCGADAAECDLFESYCTAWNISGGRFCRGDRWEMNPDGFTSEMTPRGEKILEAANSVRAKILPPLLTLSDKLTKAEGTDGCVRGYCAALYEFLVELGIPGELSRQAALLESEDRRAEASELIQLWDIAIDALDCAALILGDSDEYSAKSKKSITPVTVTEFTAALRLLFDSRNIGTIPASSDEVLVGSAAMIRAGGKRHAFILGLCDGDFPAKPEDSGIFGTGDRAELERIGLFLSGGNGGLSDELYFCYRAITCAFESLTLSYSRAETGGGAKRPSFALERVRMIFPDIVTQTSTPLEEKIYSEETALEYVAMCAAENKDSGAELPSRAALRDYFAARLEFADILNKAALPLAQRSCAISSRVAEHLFGGDLHITPSRLETYALCGMSYYCGKVLKLRTERRAEIKYNDVGIFIHYIMERFFSVPDALEIKDKHKLGETLDAIVTEYIGSICMGELGSERISHLFKRLRSAAFLLVENLLEEFSQGLFKPVAPELNLTAGESPPGALCVRFPDKSRVFLHGVIDRLDVFRDEKTGDVYFRVVDYKTGTKNFKLSEIGMGINLQLLIYLFAVRKSENSGFLRRLGIEPGEQPIPAGMLYFSARPPDFAVEGGAEPEEIEEMTRGKLERTGLLIDDEHILRAMENGLEGKYIPVKIKGNGKLSVTGGSLKSLSDFGGIYGELSDIITRIAAAMKSGRASAEPVCEGARIGRNICRYCDYRTVCRSPDSDNGM